MLHHTWSQVIISSIASFKSALKTHLFFSGLFDCFFCVREVVCHWFRACVFSGHIPYRKCCSVYVIGVQIAFHITHYSTPQNIKHFRTRHTFRHITPPFMSPPFTSHHSPPHHCTLFPYHTTTYHIFHATSRRQNLMSQHVSPQTITFYIMTSHYTAVCLASHHHISKTAQHTAHHTATVHISHHSTSATYKKRDMRWICLWNGYKKRDMRWICLWNGYRETNF